VRDGGREPLQTAPSERHILTKKHPVTHAKEAGIGIDRAPSELGKILKSHCLSMLVLYKATIQFFSESPHKSPVSGVQLNLTWN
jgi:hypothetical protein